MRILSYNINGIRAALNKDIHQWFTEVQPDMICLQELKADQSQFDPSLFENSGYHCLWHSAEKKGYSGVALLSKKKADKVSIGFGKSLYDREGRVIRADFGDITQLSLYIPSGSSGNERQDFKMEFLGFFLEWVRKLMKERPNLIISGDFNICHQAIDIHDPVRNATSSGFLPEEREWMSDFIKLGFTDSFRFMNPGIKKYSWWSYRARAREKNLGWRIDYNMISNTIQNRILKAELWNEVVHSDHCPVFLEIAD